jgi:quercetin dioxygenase-like cupin family protein
MDEIKIHKLAALSTTEVFPGYTGKFIHTKNMSIAHWRIKANSPLPEHSHVNEQVLYLVEGVFRIWVSGQEHELHSGDVLVIPSNVPHKGFPVTDCFIIDTFYPVREDYPKSERLQ